MTVKPEEGSTMADNCFGEGARGAVGEGNEGRPVGCVGANCTNPNCAFRELDEAEGDGAMISLMETGRLGRELQRPESVLCLAEGAVVTSSMTGGALEISAQGEQRPLGSPGAGEGKLFIGNGLALTREGTLLIANMGEAGGVWALGGDGALTPFLTEIEGQTLGATNFVYLDHWGRIWITVSTRRWPISEAFYDHVEGGQGDGYVILIENGVAGIVADGLCFANELRIDAAGTYLYVAETFAHRIVRFPILENSQLGERELFAALGEDNFPDGLAFDIEGHLWVTSLISNRILRLAPDGSCKVMLEEFHKDYVEGVVGRLATRSMRREDIAANPGTILQNPSSLAFGGPDLRSVYVGSLTNNVLVTFRAPVAGVALAVGKSSVDNNTGPDDVGPAPDK
jgi:sugar lactone lactonase YvrE